MLKLSIVIVNWNVIDLLSSCIDSLKTHLADMAYEIIVVDNASIDDSAAVLREKYSDVIVIANDSNRGFSKANNQGFKIAKGEYILILNPDTLIKDDSIQKMIKVLESDKKIGMVGPRIFDEAGVITPPCRRSNISLGYLFCRHFLLQKIYYYSVNKAGFLRRKYERKFYKSEPVDCIQGACMLVRKRDLDNVGFFDETIPMYLDDRDLCYRFNKAGLTVFFAADAEIIHYCGASMKKSAMAKMYDIVSIQAADAFLLKHKTVFYVIAHHLMLCAAAVVLISIDILLFPILFFTMRGYILSIIKKHFYIFLYGLTGKSGNGPFAVPKNDVINIASKGKR